MPGILKHKITFDCETSQLHSGTIICPSRQSGRLGLLLLALLAFCQNAQRLPQGKTSVKRKYVKVRARVFGGR